MREIANITSLNEVRDTISSGNLSHLSISTLITLLESVSFGETSYDIARQICDELEKESVIYEMSYEETISDILFEISSPDVNGEISAKRCAEIVQNLKFCLQ